MLTYRVGAGQSGVSWCITYNRISSFNILARSIDRIGIHRIGVVDGLGGVHGLREVG